MDLRPGGRPCRAARVECDGRRRERRRRAPRWHLLAAPDDVAPGVRDAADDGGLRAADRDRLLLAGPVPAGVQPPPAVQEGPHRQGSRRSSSSTRSATRTSGTSCGCSTGRSTCPHRPASGSSIRLGPIPPFNPTKRPQMVGWAQETSLDVQYSHAIAPGANILLVETPVAETLGVEGFPQIVRAENFVVNHHLGNVISQSFGAPEAGFPSAGSGSLALPVSPSRHPDAPVLDAVALGRATLARQLLLIVPIWVPSRRSIDSVGCRARSRRRHRSRCGRGSTASQPATSRRRSSHARWSRPRSTGARSTSSRARTTPRSCGDSPRPPRGRRHRK